MRLAARFLIAGALAAGALAPADAGAVEWGANAGVEWQQLDTEATGGPSTSVPRLDVNLSLDTSGGTPGLLAWNAGVGYRRVAVTRDGLDDVRELVSYRLRSSFFGSGVVAADAHAARTDEAVSLESVSSTNVHTNVYGGSLRLRARARPYFTGSYVFTGTEFENPLLGASERTVQSIRAGTGFGSQSYTYRANYQLNLSEGTFALDDYDDHRVDVLVDAHVTPKVTLTVTDGYFLRVPGTDPAGVDAPRLNARYETNTFVASLRVDSSRSNAQAGGYAYSHALRSVRDGEEVERTNHRLSYTLQRELPNPEYRLRGDVRATYAEDRIDGTTTRTAGETLGLTGYWRRTRKPDSMEVHVRSSVGLLEPAGGDTRVGWGAGAGGFLTRLLGTLSTSVSYDLSYARDIDAEAGWSLSQSATGSASGGLGRGSLTGSLLLSSTRRDHPFLGTAASRSVTLQSGYTRGRSNVRLQASLQDGGDNLSGGLRDGLFIAPAFDSHTRSASLGASTAPWRFLVLNARVRYAVTDLPDRPSSDEQEAYGSIDYVYGALRLSIEDRYVIVGSAGGELRVNQIFLRASRAFGSRL